MLTAVEEANIRESLARIALRCCCEGEIPVGGYRYAFTELVNLLKTTTASNLHENVIVPRLAIVKIVKKTSWSSE